MLARASILTDLKRVQWYADRGEHWQAVRDVTAEIQRAVDAVYEADQTAASRDGYDPAWSHRTKTHSFMPTVDSPLGETREHDPAADHG